MKTFHALRFVEGTDLRDRKHADTLGRFDTFEDADNARRDRRRPELLEVVVRSEREPS